MTLTFGEYLEEKHMEDYRGDPDYAMDDFGEWLDGLDPQDLIDFAEAWGKLLKEEYVSAQEENTRPKVK